jgi:hypothetical protein
MEPEGGRSIGSDSSKKWMKDEDDWERRLKIEADTGTKVVSVKMVKKSAHFVRMKTPTLFHSTQDLLIMGYEPLIYSDRKRYLPLPSYQSPPTRAPPPSHINRH